MTDNIFDKSGFSVQGHIHIFDPSTGETIINKRNAIHYENMSIALAESLSNAGQGFVYQMAFGNGGTQTFIKVVDDQSANNTDPNRNKIETRHVTGTNYTDILVSTILDYGEPSGQDANDTAQNTASNFVFDELGLVSYSPAGTGKLLTHVIFHPVQKSLNRLIQIDYTLRVQSLTGFNEG